MAAETLTIRRINGAWRTDIHTSHHTESELRALAAEHLTKHLEEMCPPAGWKVHVVTYWNDGTWHAGCGQEDDPAGDLFWPADGVASLLEQGGRCGIDGCHRNPVAEVRIVWPGPGGGEDEATLCRTHILMYDRDICWVIRSLTGGDYGHVQRDSPSVAEHRPMPGSS